MLAWEGDNYVVVGETRFHVQAWVPLIESLDPEQVALVVCKSPQLVERHAALVEELAPQHIFELGFFGGGSTLFFAQLARPRRLVTIDLERADSSREVVERLAAERGLGDVIRVHLGVDQADRPRLAEIAGEAFGGAPLDLVVDDCSHLYEPSRASFNELFPRLRPGGAYVIEDWRWAHPPLDAEHPEGMFPDEVPLTRLMFEILLAAPSVPGLIDEVTVDLESIVVRRGEAEVDSEGFDVASCSNERGRKLLTC